MKEKQNKHRILILGGSGFIGNALYKELLSYFEVYGTYCKQHGIFSENKVFFNFCVEKDLLSPLLEKIQPTVIISSIKGSYDNQLKAHKEIEAYILQNTNCSVIFISSSEVFSAKPLHPSYENDFPLSETDLGRFKISIEKLFLENTPEQTTIIRLPMVLGVNSPIIFHLRQCIRHRAVFEVFPNLIVTATTINKLVVQIHFMINHSLRGIYHLASNNMVHHDELFKEISSKISDRMPIFKSVFSSNEDRYSALLPKHNMLDSNYQITISEVIEESSLEETIVSVL